MGIKGRGKTPNHVLLSHRKENSIIDTIDRRKVHYECPICNRGFRIRDAFLCIQIVASDLIKDFLICDRACAERFRGLIVPATELKIKDLLSSFLVPDYVREHLSQDPITQPNAWEVKDTLNLLYLKAEKAKHEGDE